MERILEMAHCVKTQSVSSNLLERAAFHLSIAWLMFLNLFVKRLAACSRGLIASVLTLLAVAKL